MPTLIPSSSLDTDHILSFLAHPAGEEISIGSWGIELDSETKNPLDVLCKFIEEKQERYKLENIRFGEIVTEIIEGDGPGYDSFSVGEYARFCKFVFPKPRRSLWQVWCWKYEEGEQRLNIRRPLKFSMLFEKVLISSDTNNKPLSAHNTLSFMEDFEVAWLIPNSACENEYVWKSIKPRVDEIFILEEKQPDNRLTYVEEYTIQLPKQLFTIKLLDTTIHFENDKHDGDLMVYENNEFQMFIKKPLWNIPRGKYRLEKDCLIQLSV